MLEKKLYNEELHNSYSSPNIIRIIKSRRMRWTGQVVCMKNIRNTYKILVRKPGPLGRPRYMREQ
jgi:hypothetical protein